MSKTSNMINMVNILEDKKIHSIKELSSILEVSERMIRVYKAELEQAGIYINSKKGIYGGYILDDNLNHIDIGLTYSDINTLITINNRISNNFDKEEYSKVIDKIYNAYIKNLNTNNTSKLKHIESTQNELSSIYKDFRKAIDNKNKAYIEFFSVNSGNTKRIIHPAELFCCLNEWYIAAFCEKRNEIRLFKLNNITDYKILKEKYCDF